MLLLSGLHMFTGSVRWPSVSPPSAAVSQSACRGGGSVRSGPEGTAAVLTLDHIEREERTSRRVAWQFWFCIKSISAGSSVSCRLTISMMSS